MVMHTFAAIGKLSFPYFECCYLVTTWICCVGAGRGTVCNATGILLL